MNYFDEYSSPIGKIFLVSNGENLTGLYLPGHEKWSEIEAEFLASRQPNLPIFEKAKKWLDDYFVGKNPSPENILVQPKGSGFCQEVWAILRQIPPGQTLTYGEVAKKVAKKLNKPKMSAQAVGSAIGKNPIMLVVPCHRVVGVDGKLTGFSAGVDSKRWLLDFEAGENPKPIK